MRTKTEKANLNVKEGIEEMTLEQVVLGISSFSFFQQLEIEINDLVVKPLSGP